MSSNREKEIFLDAIDIDGVQERAKFLDEACGSDPSLRQAIELLLKAHDQSVAVVDGSTNPQDQLQKHVNRAAEAFGLSQSQFTPSAGPEEYDRTGENIHQYKLMEKLGEGGFGQVYVAHQKEPVQRSVAMKLLKPGMDTKEILARFEAERQALALMNHPNIAQVFDAGATQQGQPYIAMELVRGVPITTFCRQKQLDVPARLELFRDVCQAVHHAHQKGIIHRDLKPSNILVAQHGTDPLVKVIDFGVAKALNDPLTDKTIYTRFAQLIGTPMYMSPEQAELNALDVDTRSDIYSLGVLLYELLTETTPIQQQRLQTASFDEMRRIIREEEPPRPSLRLSNSTIKDGAKELRSEAESKRLAGQLVGDLDWIVMQSIEKDRRRRYETAADLSRDIERFMLGQPVVARPPSKWYRFSKFAQRNRMPLIAATLVTLALVTGTVVSTWQAIRATNAQAEAERLRNEAVDFAQRLKDSNVLLVRARANADQGRIRQAYEAYTAATKLTPDHYLTWAGRGSLLASEGAYRESAIDYSQAIALGGTGTDPSWWGVPYILLHAERMKDYELVRKSLLQEIDTLNDAAQLTRASRVVCIREVDSETATKVLAAVARRAVSSDQRFDFLVDFEEPESEAQIAEEEEPARIRPNGPPLPSRSGPKRPEAGAFAPKGIGMLGAQGRLNPKPTDDYTLALAHFRAGEFAPARRLLSKMCDPQRNSRPPPGLHHMESLLALVHHNLGNAQGAERMLRRAERADKDWMQAVRDSEHPFPWFDGLESHLLFCEAVETIRGESVDEALLDELEAEAVAQWR